MNTTVKFGNVEWSNDYKHIQLYDSRSTQQTAITNKMTKSYTHVNVIRKNQPFVIKVSEGADFNNFNYMMYQNASVSSKWYYAFIDRVVYNADETVTIYHTCDAWQTYQFDITYLDQKIVRAHIKKSDDKIGAYTEREPVGANITCETNLFSSSLLWRPAWNMNALSIPATTESGGFKYGGYNGGTENATGHFAISLNRYLSTIVSTSLSDLINMYNDPVTTLSFRSRIDEIINLSCVPRWVESKATTDEIIKPDSSPPGIPTYHSNKEITQTETVTVNFNKIKSNGTSDYTPVNKKLLTSMCRCFAIYNKNGTKILLKPELFTDTAINNGSFTISYGMRPINCNNIRLRVNSYNNLTSSIIQVPYGASLGIGYNSNQGLAGFMNKLTAFGGAVAGVGSAVAGGVGGFIGAVTGVENAVSTVFDAQAQQLGTCSDVTSVSDEYIKPHIIEIAPVYDELVELDNYLTMFGYALNVYGKIDEYMTNRTNWNYIKVEDCNIKVIAPNEDIATLKAMFEHGVTIWRHNFGDYSHNNN